MSKKYFGTDGIRGRANQHPMTADVALRVAMAAARVLRREDSVNRAIIGKDTRRSCYMLEQAMASGFLAMGIDVILTGPIPTPGIAMLARSMRADIGVMISASHNPYYDNGIKLFASDGYKLPDDIEARIEDWIDNPELTQNLPEPNEMGKASRMDDAPGRYIEYVKSSFPKGQTLGGLKIVVDCAHGAAYKVAPQTLWELEAEVVTVGVHPDGQNINHERGATAIARLQEKVQEHKADLGIAFDGDADRVIFVDEKSQKIDGDQLLALMAIHMKSQGLLKNDTVVSTVMSNLGFENFLKDNGINLIRAAVGDRYVVEKMREGGFNLGGEQSGHIVLSDYGTTGDGLLAALHVLSVVKGKGGKASEALNLFEPLPQLLKNVRFEKGQKPLQNELVQSALQKAEKTLANDGRVLVRASGTEPLIRIMAEGRNQKLVESVVDDLCQVIQTATKK